MPNPTADLPAAATTIRSLWDDVCAWWQRTHELDTLDAREIEMLAHDIGMEPSEFLALARGQGGDAALLFKRLEALKISPDEIRAVSNLLLADLQRTCTQCTERGRCKSDFKERPLAEEWKYYCPNSDALASLQTFLKKSGPVA
jgi:uncharacterized protein YjiS (DUF1127 family)